MKNPSTTLPFPSYKRFSIWLQDYRRCMGYSEERNILIKIIYYLFTVMVMTTLYIVVKMTVSDVEQVRSSWSGKVKS